MFETEMKKALNDILKEELFDDIINNLYKLCILPFFNEIKYNLQKSTIPTEKPLIRQKFQLLLGLYFNKIFNNSGDNFDHLYSKFIDYSNKIDSTKTISTEIKLLLK